VTVQHADEGVFELKGSSNGPQTPVRSPDSELNGAVIPPLGYAAIVTHPLWSEVVGELGVLQLDPYSSTNRSSGFSVSTRPTSSGSQIGLFSTGIPRTARIVGRAATLRGMLALIRESFGLNVTSTAAVLRVERPTIYAWLGGTVTPHPANRARILTLAHLGQRWQSMSGRRLGLLELEDDSDGESLLGLLTEPEVPVESIQNRLLTLAARSVPATKKPGVREVAERSGIDTDRIFEQDDQIDLIAGKKFPFD